LKQVRPEVTREKLGTKTIFGVVATGTRTTRTIPTGAQGNDAPMVTTDEMWSAPGIGLLEQKRESAEMGNMTREVTRLEIGEPDPALFQPPADYEIVQHEMQAGGCTNTTHAAPVRQPAPPSN
jgi:hypothetical protein